MAHLTPLIKYMTLCSKTNTHTHTHTLQKLLLSLLFSHVIFFLVYGSSNFSPVSDILQNTIIFCAIKHSQYSKVNIHIHSENVKKSL